MKLAGLSLALCFLLAPAARGQAVDPPPQCRSYGNVFDFYGGSAHFQSHGLSVAQCQALCRKHAASCKQILKLTHQCARKSIAHQLALDLKTECDTLSDPSARASCRRELKSAAASEQAAQAASVAELRGNCDVVVRGWCSDECEGG